MPGKSSVYYWLSLPLTAEKNFLQSRVAAFRIFCRFLELGEAIGPAQIGYGYSSGGFG
jgi:hypothetical protein